MSHPDRGQSGRYKEVTEKEIEQETAFLGAAAKELHRRTEVQTLDGIVGVLRDLANIPKFSGFKGREIKLSAPGQYHQGELDATTTIATVQRVNKIFHLCVFKPVLSGTTIIHIFEARA